jgi:hypothetical protein
LNPILIFGTSIVNVALICYSCAFYFIKKQKRISLKAYRFQIIAVSFDIIATACMIIGSSNSPFTLHGILGYSSLSGMILDTYFILRVKSKKGIDSILPNYLKIYSTVAYLWWILAYITGALIVAFR